MVRWGRNIVAVAALVTVAAAYGQSEEKAIKALFMRQATAMSQGNVEAYMSTIDPSVPAFGQTRQMMSSLFKAYKLKATIEKLKVESIKGNSAKVSMVLLTTKVSGPTFRNNRTNIMNAVTKKNGKWVNSDSKMMGITYLQ